jgi:P-type Cu+ transporter
MFKDPVCGMDVGTDTEFTYDYEGQTYYFCSQDCLDSFKSDPLMYLEKSKVGQYSEMSR